MRVWLRMTETSLCLLDQPLSRQDAQAHIHMASEHLQGEDSTASGQPVPLLCHQHDPKYSTHIQTCKEQLLYLCLFPGEVPE